MHRTDKYFLGGILSILGYGDDVKANFDWEEAVKTLSKTEPTATQDDFKTLYDIFENKVKSRKQH